MTNYSNLTKAWIKSEEQTEYQVDNYQKLFKALYYPILKYALYTMPHCTQETQYVDVPRWPEPGITKDLGGYQNVLQ